MDHVVTILMVNVYVYSLEEWLLKHSRLPCDKKLKHVTFTKRLEAAIIKECSQRRSNSFKCILYVLQKPLCEEKINANLRCLYISDFFIAMPVY